MAKSNQQEQKQNRNQHAVRKKSRVFLLDAQRSHEKDNQEKEYRKETEFLWKR